MREFTRVAPSIVPLLLPLESLVLGRVGRGKLQRLIDVLCLLQEEAKGVGFSALPGWQKGVEKDLAILLGVLRGRIWTLASLRLMIKPPIKAKETTGGHGRDGNPNKSRGREKPEVEILEGEDRMPPLEPLSREELSIGYARRGAEFVRRGDDFDLRGADFERRRGDFDEWFGYDRWREDRDN
ncbi:hypothetical protein MA16_Dca024387 [Dendrobium catenatum]|uniref:Uncharacterized protein n=1 Tax=Dendrobium catenatum TaxID=906689 RepID=A0A2I0WVX9_9ASPA|nr:hypothetical protein MA16_Dca024387 [Dendrobium catenatum]